MTISVGTRQERVQAISCDVEPTGLTTPELSRRGLTTSGSPWSTCIGRSTSVEAQPSAVRKPQRTAYANGCAGHSPASNDSRKPPKVTTEAERGFRSLSIISTSSSHPAWGAPNVRFAGWSGGFAACRYLPTLATKARETARLRAKDRGAIPGSLRSQRASIHGTREYPRGASLQLTGWDIQGAECTPFLRHLKPAFHAHSVIRP